MPKKAPGKSHRRGVTLVALMDMFHDDSTAKAWFEQQFWPNGPVCPYCESSNVQANIKHRTMTHRCRECPGRRMFSLRTGTVMEGSKLPYKVWAIAVYLLTTNLKGVSSMKLHRDLGISQKSAWHLAHRLRKSLEAAGKLFEGPVEVDETYIGGRERNKHGSKKMNAGRGTVGKAAIVGAKDRQTNHVSAAVVENTDRPTLQGFISERVHAAATVYTDEHSAYQGLPNHAAVKHSVGEFVRDQAHTNGVESFWSMLKRGYHGTYHRMSHKHLDRYVAEFACRHNHRESDTLDQMAVMVQGMNSKRLRYQDLVA